MQKIRRRQWQQQLKSTYVHSLSSLTDRVYRMYDTKVLYGADYYYYYYYIENPYVLRTELTQGAHN